METKGVRVNMRYMDYGLPDLIDRNGFASWEEYFDKIYEIFVRDFVHYHPVFRGKRLRLKRHPLIDGKEYTFYHLINSGPENDRTGDLDRCARIKWPRPIIEKCETFGLKIWPQIRNGKNRICIWLELTDEPDYIVILDVRENYILPWTAYVVKYDNEKEKKQKEYDEYIKSKNRTI
jgi:hypothetical protein